MTGLNYKLLVSEVVACFSAVCSCLCCMPVGNSAFWPLDVVGAPYYISDYAATNVVSSGKVCDGITFYECYQTLTDGVYILRLGGGLFGRLTGQYCFYLV